MKPKGTPMEKIRSVTYYKNRGLPVPAETKAARAKWKRERHIPTGRPVGRPITVHTPEAIRWRNYKRVAAKERRAEKREEMKRNAM